LQQKLLKDSSTKTAHGLTDLVIFSPNDAVTPIEADNHH
jgi:hypothetical protein